MKRVLELGVVWSLGILIREDLLDERKQSPGLGRFTKHLGSHPVLQTLDPLELSVVELGIGDGGLRFLILRQESEIAVDEVEKQVNERNQVIFFDFHGIWRAVGTSGSLS